MQEANLDYRVNNNSFFSPFVNFKNKITKAMPIIFEEGKTVLSQVLPSSIKWVFRRYVTGSISCHKIEYQTEKTKRVAYLYFHGNLKSLKEATSPLLFSHGDFGHPYTTLHLADLAVKNRHASFSLYIPQNADNQYFKITDKLNKLAIDKVFALAKENGGEVKGVRVAGHSKGGIMQAYRRFVMNDERITACFGIAARLSYADESKEDPYLLPYLKQIDKEVRALNKLKVPLYQVVPTKDYLVPQDSMKVRPNQNCYEVEGMHLSALYKDNTLITFQRFLSETTI